MVLIGFGSNLSSQHIPQQIQHKRIFTHLPVSIHTQKCVCVYGAQTNCDLELWSLLTILRQQSALWLLRISTKV